MRGLNLCVTVEDEPRGLLQHSLREVHTLPQGVRQGNI